MAVCTNECVIILLGIIIIGCTGKPQILNIIGEEYIIHSGDNFSIQCHGVEQLNWIYPQGNTTNVEIINIKSNHQDFPFASNLTIYNASYESVGFYYCNENDDPKKSTNIYIYVEDDVILSVLNSDYETINALQHSEIIIPCRPTSPDVQVVLYSSFDDSKVYYWDKVQLGVVLDDHSTVSFDRRIGFIRVNNNPVEGLQDTQIYTCMFYRNTYSKNITVVIDVQSVPEYISRPYIEDLNHGHTVIGKNITLKCTVKHSFHSVNFTWLLPNKNRKSVLGKPYIETTDLFFTNLTISDLTKDDQGLYTCLVTDGHHDNNSTKNIPVFGVGENFIKLSEENNVLNINVSAGKPSVQWRIDVLAHPIENLVLTWFDNKHNEILSWSDTKSKKYETNVSSSEAFLKINSIAINDFGNYTLTATNGYANATLSLILYVTDKPSVAIDIDNYHLLWKTSTIKCAAAGYPEPKIYWQYKPCLDNSCETEDIIEDSVTHMGLQVISEVKIYANKSGYVSCGAVNSYGNDYTTAGFYVTDINENGFNIWTSDNVVNQMNTSKVAKEEVVELYCAVSIYNYTDQIHWFKNGILIESEDNHIIERSHTEYSYKTTLRIRNITVEDYGSYKCNVSLNELTLDKSIQLEVTEPGLPEIFDSNLNGTFKMDLPQSVTLKCYISGIPKPTIIWQKDNVELVMNNRTTLNDNGQVLQFEKTVESDEGSYKCIAENRVGTDFRTMDIYFNNKPSAQWMYFIIVVLTTILLCCIIFLVVKIRREKVLKYELRKVGLEHFEKGAVDSLNPELGIDDQAELLPYDKKWEFPREKLKFGKQLGSGAFGVVIKAEAEAIVNGEDSTTVAVKMVKRNAETAYIRALASELKIMVHLGKHVNVVNLLGACTKNVAKLELLVIVEYCQFGNLQNYMFRHRENFIDQIDQSTGCINFAIGSDVLDRSVSFSSNRSNSNSSKSTNLKYIALKFSKNSEQGGHINKMMADYRGANYTGQSTQTESTVVMMSPTGTTDEQVLTSNSSSQPEWRSNYRGDYKDNTIQAISTKDLLSWAFQVARAMEYLASRKVLHGDLAARNILLSENNVVKICDFGLAKSMYKSGNYKKKGDGPLPVKWMAVESLRDRIFSTESDVWSFGIVLWEFFSLAKSPYPGMEADERLYQKLIDGYRMDSPKYATNDIYQMMLNCWDCKPTERPSFTKLVERIGTMLDESVKQHYIDLNDPYLVMNTNRLEEGESDYLAMFTPPNFENLSSPQHYINNIPNNEQTNGYMCMKPGQIFSPRENTENMFMFDVNNKLSDSESEAGLELRPMLKSPTDFGDNVTTVDSFSNPSYHILSNISPNGDNTTILKSSDNYVNMPQNKSAIIQNNSPEKYVEGPEKPYINSTTRDWERVPT